MKTDACGKEWIGADGKEHMCTYYTHGPAIRCSCDCGEKIPPAKPSVEVSEMEARKEDFGRE